MENFLIFAGGISIHINILLSSDNQNQDVDVRDENKSHILFAQDDPDKPILINDDTNVTIQLELLSSQGTFAEEFDRDGTLLFRDFKSNVRGTFVDAITSITHLYVQSERGLGITTLS